MPTIKTDDNVALYYELEGEATSPVLLFSNSLGANLNMWEAQRDAFDDRFRILRYDSRGHGRSEVPTGPYSIERLARDVSALLDGLSAENVTFCGISLGGMVGMWLGANQPERFDRLVLCNTSAHMPPPKNWTERANLARNGKLNEIVEPVIERWFTAPFRERRPEVVERIRTQFLVTPSEGYAGSCEAIGSMDQRETIGSIRVPTLVIAGEKDPATPPEQGRFIAERIPGALYHEISDAAHLSNIEQGDRFNSALGDFLAE